MPDRPAEPADRRPPAGGRLRILLVDDTPAILEVLGEVLRAEGCVVEGYTDPLAALPAVTEGAFHLIFSDIKMPEVTGLEFLRRARAQAPGTPVVLITAFAEVESAVAALRRGAFDYLVKPFALADIRRIVGRVRQEQRLAAEHPDLLGARRHEVLAAVLGEALEQKRAEVHALISGGRVLQSARRLEDLLERTLEQACLAAAAEVGVVLLADGQGRPARVVAVRPAGDGNGHGPLTVPAEVEARPGEPRLADPLLAAPLAIKGEPVGAVVVRRGAARAPFTPDDLELLVGLTATASVALENASLYANLEAHFFEMIRALVTVLEAKDKYTEGHSVRVTRYAVEIARALGLPEATIGVIRYGGILHDVGKVGIVDAVLQKPGRLTAEELRHIQQHPVLGWAIIAPLSFLREEALVVRHHHEWYDGRGYPDGLAGEAIPLTARVLAVADAFDAMTSTRPYRPALRVAEAVAELEKGAASGQFDPTIVRAFVEVLTRDPALARLAEGRAWSAA
jgi:response regulator RpfG family c-di-GMP phosphodiesterase